MNRDKPRSTNNTGVSSAGESQGQNLRRDPEVAARNQRIVARYQEGAPLKDLATEFGVSIGLVTTVISSAGVAQYRRKPKDPKVAARNQRIVARYQDGAPIKNLAAEFGVSVRLVNNVIRAAGVTKTRRKPRDPEVAARNQRIVARYQDGAPYKELAAEFGSLVGTVINAAGVAQKRSKQMDLEVAARNKRIVARYQEGAPYKELAAEFGISRSLVGTVISAAGMARGRTSPRDPKVAARNKRIVARYQEGVPYKELAAEFGISRNLVYIVISAAGMANRRSVSNPIV